MLAVCGPTATGKTALAIRLAQRLNGEIVCADSMQIYAGLRVGTAQPDEAEKRAVPHHLFGFVDPACAYSVSDYVRDAQRAIAQIAARGRLPVLCGGTGLYIRALLSGLRFGEAQPNPALRRGLWEELERRGAESLVAEIAQRDPALAQTLHVNNKKRIVRALELLRTTGKTRAALDDASMQGARPYPHVTVLLCCENRAFLYSRIERRVEQMLARGLLEEARLVYDNRERYTTAAQAIGYKEFFPYFAQAAPLEDCVDALKQATRRYAKRQLTWFRREQDAHWVDIEQTPPEQIVRQAAGWYGELEQRQKGT